MKKALTFFLLLIYFTASTGFIINYHYCMNEFDSVQIGNPGSETCDKCGMHNADNECCFDDVKVLKLKESHLAAELLIASFSLPEAVFTTTEFLLTSLENFDLEESSYPRHGPPLLSEHKTYLQNRVFRV